MVWICLALLISDFESLFVFYGPFIYHLWRNVYPNFLPIFFLLYNILLCLLQLFSTQRLNYLILLQLPCSLLCYLCEISFSLFHFQCLCFIELKWISFGQHIVEFCIFCLFVCLVSFFFNPFWQSMFFGWGLYPFV